MIGPESLSDVKDRIAQQITTECISAAPQYQPYLRAESLQRGMDLFRQNGLIGDHFAGDLDETVARADQTTDRYPFDVARRAMIVTTIERGEII
jgi:uncharacterized protein CbrC (UPF0167 family)